MTAVNVLVSRRRCESRPKVWMTGLCGPRFVWRVSAAVDERSSSGTWQRQVQIYPDASLLFVCIAMLRVLLYKVG
jgi:hypothetical protein